MLDLITRSVIPWLLVMGCGTNLDARDTTVADHERAASHYEATASSIEAECAKARRNELTVGEAAPCWKAKDMRFLDANRIAAAKHRIAAAKLRAATSTSASR